MERRFVTVEGNEAAAFVAHRTNEVIGVTDPAKAGHVSGVLFRALPG